MEKLLHRNIIKIYFMVFFQSAMVVTAVFVPLMQRHGLSMAQVLQTQALFALVVAISEVPSGYLADLWGRKNTIVLGAGLCVIAFGCLIFADSFADFLLYELLMGLGISLNSGADLALLYDSQTQLNRCVKPQRNVDSGHHIARLVAIEGFAGAIAALGAALLVLCSLDWVLWAQFIISVLAFVFALSLVESPRIISTHGHRENLQQVKFAIMSDSLVLWTSAAIIIFGLAALYTFWLYQKYWELLAIPISSFGYIWAVHCIIRAITAFYAHNIERLIGARNVLWLAALFPIVGFLGMGLMGGYLGLCLGLAFPLSRGLSMVVLYDALNKRINAEFRATVNSLVSLGTRGIFIVSGPALGYLVDTQGVQISLLTLAAIFTPLFALILIPLNNMIKHVKTEKEEKLILET